ncbi:MAG: aa3-type cytochrome c oxidase subunit IV [Pseudomonadota bacterium]
MAEHKHGEMDVADQEQTFMGFVNATKWVVIAVLVLLILMAVFIS